MGLNFFCSEVIPLASMAVVLGGAVAGVDALVGAVGKASVRLPASAG